MTVAPPEVAAALAAVLVVMLGAGVRGVAFGAVRGRERRRRPSRRSAAVRSSLRRHVDAPRRRVIVQPRAVADWCEAVARRLRGGATLREAVRSEVPTDPALARVTHELRRRIERGEPLAVALRDTATSPGPGGTHLALATAAFATAAELGGPAAPTLDRVGATLRLRAADAAERAAQSMQARLSAHVLTAVPIAVVALLAGSDAEVRRALTRGTGIAVLAAGLALNAAGWWWMRRIVRAVA